MTLKEYLTTRAEAGCFAEVYDEKGDLPWAIVFIDSGNVFIDRMNQHLLTRTVKRAEFVRDGSYTSEIYRIEVE